MKLACFGAGCFWCVEAVFREVRGVKKALSAYAGGQSSDPNYEEVCSGKSGHAEVCQIHFDPLLISYSDLLEVFWKTHDPTSLNRQGNDRGSQYRSVIFYYDEEQRNLALQSRKDLENSGFYGEAPIVTQIEPLENFYLAEDYHQNYYQNKPRESYCLFVIRPKMEKFYKTLSGKLKSNLEK